MTRDQVFYDTEFFEQGPDHPIYCISVGMIDNQGNTLYGINLDAPWHLISADPWLAKNVLPHLPGNFRAHGWKPDYYHQAFVSRAELAAKVRRFVLRLNQPRLNAWYSAHDHVVLTQLLGTMAQLPTGFPMSTHDLLDDWERAGSPELPQQTSVLHHALEDAHHAKAIHDYLAGMDRV